MTKTEEILIKLASNFWGIDSAEITPESDFFDDLNVGTIDLGDFFLLTQEKFKVKLVSEGIENIKTIADLARAIENSDEFI